ncbi:transporter [Variovorax humicola]|uniref:Transporter n=1 Tax=Variovorax humicola TaxID=1769758 RepID=A0ABU8WBK4_9BURK
MKLPAARFAAHTLLAADLTGCLWGHANAEEGGSGHYAPGSMASFVDAVAPQEAFLLRVNLVNYAGSASKDVALPIAGTTALGVDANSTAFGLTAFWRPPIETGEGWSYAISATVPYVWMSVSASATAGKYGASLSSSSDGLGDMVLMPLMLNQSINPDLNINYRLAFYAPTGSYEVGRLSNTGKNFWTVEPIIGLIYLGKQNGVEASLFTGIDFNRENPATQYKTGAQFHVDGTLAQHFPWQGGLAGVGLTGYFYRQVTDDSGPGASLGAFRGQTTGLGPVASFVTKLGGHDVIAELKWLHEFEVQNRLKGDYVWLKVVYKFY